MFYSNQLITTSKETCRQKLGTNLLTYLLLQDSKRGRCKISAAHITVSSVRAREVHNSRRFSFEGCLLIKP